MCYVAYTGQILNGGLAYPSRCKRSIVARRISPVMHLRIPVDAFRLRLLGQLVHQHVPNAARIRGLVIDLAFQFCLLLQHGNVQASSPSTRPPPLLHLLVLAAEADVS